MKKRSFKKQISILCVAVMLLALVLPVFAVQTAMADGELSLILSSWSPDTMSAAGTVAISGTVKNNSGVTVNNVTIYDATTGNEISLDGTPYIEGQSSYDFTVNVTLADKHLYQDGWMVKLKAKGTTEAGVALETQLQQAFIKRDIRTSMSLTLSASNGGTNVPVNQKVTFTLLVENTGNTGLADINITDATLGSIASGFSLNAGESRTFTVEHTMVDTITVSASASAKSMIGDTAGATITATSNAITVTKAEAGLTIDITPSTLEVQRGDKVEFKGKISNTGTMDISKINITDVYGVEVMKDIDLKQGEEKEFTYETTIQNSDPYKVFITGVGTDNEEISREYEMTFNVKLSEDDVRIDMSVKADYPELEGPDSVILTFTFLNNRQEPLSMPMFVREVNGKALFTLVILSPGKTTQDYEMFIEDSTTKRFELVVTTDEGAELIAGACACSIKVQEQAEVLKPNKPDNNKNLKWLWILLGVVGFLLVAAGVVFFVLVTQERKNKARVEKQRQKRETPRAEEPGYGYDDQYDDYGGEYSGDTYGQTPMGGYSVDANIFDDMGDTKDYPATHNTYAQREPQQPYHSDYFDNASSGSTGSDFADSLYGDSLFGDSLIGQDGPITQPSANQNYLPAGNAQKDPYADMYNDPSQMSYSEEAVLDDLLAGNDEWDMFGGENDGQKRW
ncbi:MAG: hypothetical protein IKF50_04025 [Clostridia bacterium]|nr:hypothetical protein [Clostridia bacterium]